MPAGELKFVGDKVLVPACEVYCAVLMPHGIVLDVKMTTADMVDDIGGYFEAYDNDYGLLGGCSVKTMRADKYREWRDRRDKRRNAKRTTRLAATG